MSHHIEYSGYLIEPLTKPKGEPDGWTLEVRITPTDRRAKVRRCRGPNTYASEKLAIANCLEFGRQIVDGKLTPRVKPTN